MIWTSVSSEAEGQQQTEKYNIIKQKNQNLLAFWCTIKHHNLSENATMRNVPR